MGRNVKNEILCCDRHKCTCLRNVKKIFPARPCNAGNFRRDDYAARCCLLCFWFSSHFLTQHLHLIMYPRHISFIRHSDNQIPNKKLRAPLRDNFLRPSLNCNKQAILRPDNLADQSLFKPGSFLNSKICQNLLSVGCVLLRLIPLFLQKPFQQTFIDWL